MKTLFKHVTLVDGTLNAPFQGSLVIEDDKIHGIFHGDHEEPDAKVVDLKGKVLCPGFIDPHSHNDWFSLREDPERFFEPLLRQGITTLITGNCGFSAAGFAEESSHLEDLGGELFSLDELQRHSSMKQWLAHVDQALPMNIISLLGHGTARLSVAGLHQAELNENHLQRMLEVLDQGLAEGAAGISLGLMYAPGVFAPREELEKVAELCAKHHKPLTIHPRAESAISLSYSSFTKSHLLLALDEILEIQQKTGCPIVYSHLIFVGRRTWKDVDQALGSIEKAHEEGYQIGFDMYPYDFGASVITVVLPPWYQQLSPKERKKPWVKLKLPAMVMMTTKLLGFGFDDLRIAYAGDKHPEYHGKTVSEIARELSKSPFDTYIHICEESDFKARVLMGSYQNDEIIHRLMNHPLSVYMTDAWYEEEGIQNECLYGAFPRFLRLGREKGMPLEVLINKMTGQTADRYRIKNRGYLKEGYYADLVVMGAEGVTDDPESLKPRGIHEVYVNGEAVIKGDSLNFQGTGSGIAIQ